MGFIVLTVNMIGMVVVVTKTLGVDRMAVVVLAQNISLKTIFKIFVLIFVSIITIN
jgi:hypothetical protein